MSSHVAEPVSLEELVSRFQSKYGPRSLSVGSQEDVEVVSTGLLALDLILAGGLPKGRIALVFGPENTGKSTLGYQVMASVLRQSPTRFGAYFPVEYRWDPGWAQSNGVDLSRVLIPHFTSGEEVFSQLYDLAKGGVGCVIIDSLAALLPRPELETMEATREEERNREFVALQARLLSVKLRAVNPALSKAGAITLFTNQIREKPGVMYGNPETQPGGHAILHFASTILEVRRGGYVDSGYEEVSLSRKAKSGEEEAQEAFGHVVYVRTVKTSHFGARPGSRARLVLRYGYGFDDVYDRMYVARRLGILRQAGASAWLVDPATKQDLVGPDGKPARLKGGKAVLLEALQDSCHPFRQAVEAYVQGYLERLRKGHEASVALPEEEGPGDGAGDGDSG